MRFHFGTKRFVVVMIHCNQRRDQLPINAWFEGTMLSVLLWETLFPRDNDLMPGFEGTMLCVTLGNIVSERQRFNAWFWGYYALCYFGKHCFREITILMPGFEGTMLSVLLWETLFPRDNDLMPGFEGTMLSIALGSIVPERGKLCTSQSNTIRA